MKFNLKIKTIWNTKTQDMYKKIKMYNFFSGFGFGRIGPMAPEELRAA